MSSVSEKPREARDSDPDVDTAKVVATRDEAEGVEEPSPASKRPRDATVIPRFARGYPSDPRLDRLVLAFARGNHRVVRDEAEQLATTAADARVAAAARDLRSRLEPDRIAYVLLGTTALLLIALSLWAMKRSSTLDQARPPAATTAPSTSERLR